MKVILINTVFGTGSTGRITAELYRMLKTEEEQSRCAYGRSISENHSEALGNDGYRVGSRMDFYRHVCRNFLLGENGFGSKGATKRLIQWLSEEKPDILHLHNIHGFYLQVELLFEYVKAANIPVVWTFHDCYPFTGHCAYYEKNGCTGFETGCLTCHYHASVYPYALFRDRAAESFQRKKKAFTGVRELTIVTPSRWLAAEVKKSFLKDYPIKVIPNGIDLQCFSMIEKKYQNAVFEILGVANIWEERKGLFFFEKLAEQLPEQYHITLIGLSPGQISRMSRKYPASRLTPLGRTEKIQQLADAYGRADVFVNPTLEDNFPTANLEALACGTPVVTFQTGGSPETIDDTCGIVVEKGNEKALAEAVAQACRAPFPAGDCRKRAMKYDKKERYAEYRRLYLEILGKENRR